jgi:peptidoglycan/xylan/chitin deacetylase (PgdA/CDA1 family)
MLEEAVGGAAASASREPKVDQAVMRIAREVETSDIESRGFHVRKCRWPENAPFAACLTHDVDNVSRPRSHILKVRERFGASDLVLALLGLRSLYDNLERVAAQEESRGFRSSFYLLSSNYDLRRLRGRLAELQRRGWDIGLHGDFGTHDSAEAMARARRRFTDETGIEPAGLREHYLKFDYATSWEIFEDSGFAYDTSVGNTDSLGFRLGMSAPFHPPDPDWKPRKILEIPLAIMDTTLWGYLKRTEEEGKRDIVDMLGLAKAAGGVFTMLWHTESVRMKGGRIYPYVLDLISGSGCFVSSGRGIADWWKARSSPLVLGEKAASIADCPARLCLVLKAKDVPKVEVEGGEARVVGNIALVTAHGGDLKVTWEV